MTASRRRLLFIWLPLLLLMWGLIGIRIIERQRQEALPTHTIEPERYRRTG